MTCLRYAPAAEFERIRRLHGDPLQDTALFAAFLPVG